MHTGTEAFLTGATEKSANGNCRRDAARVDGVELPAKADISEPHIMCDAQVGHNVLTDCYNIYIFKYSYLLDIVSRHVIIRYSYF